MTVGWRAEAPATLLAFGQHLKRLRHNTDLTQEELAERAGVSARLISDLKRGTIHRPRRDTAQLLADGLGLRGGERDAFIALARDRTMAPSPQSAPVAQSPYSVPLPPTPIVGRLREVAAALAFLLDREIRLLTLTGPGGVGKTRLALEITPKAAGAYSAGAAFVDLAPLRDPELVFATIAQALKQTATPDQSPRQIVFSELGGKQLLLVLDNFEHLATAAADIAELLAACPRLTILATSRVPLRIRIELEYPVGPLSLPDQSVTASLEEIARTPAVDLFVRRAEEANRGFALTTENASSIVEIAIRLDGLPLAIELAATRVKVLSPAALLARLERRLPILTGGAKDLPARQRTLSATLDWSHALLTNDEQVHFRRLVVFAGGFTLEAAESLGASPSASTQSRDGSSALDLLGSLVDKSFLRILDADGDEQRFGMLETIREYGWECLARAGEDELIRDRHLEWCVALAVRAASELNGPNQREWFRRLETEHDNLRAALTWSIGRGNGELALRLSGALALFWMIRGHFEEGRRWLNQALQLADGVPPPDKANAIVGLARLAYQQGDYELLPAVEKALALFREAGDTNGIALALCTLGMGVEDLGDHERATELEEEALALFRELDDRLNVAKLLNNRGLAAYDLGDYDRAAMLLEEALSLGRSIGSWQTVASALNNLALVAQERRDYVQAMTLQAEALDVWRGLGDKVGITNCLENFAMFAAGQNDVARSARLLGATAALRARIQTSSRPSDLELLEGFISAARRDLGEATFRSAWAEGEAMPLDDAIAHALEEDREQI